LRPELRILLERLADAPEAASNVAVPDCYLADLVNYAPIKAAACVEFAITAAELAGRSRLAKFARPRAICVHRIRDLTQPTASFAKIGRELGGRSHSTIVALEHRADRLVDAVPDLSERRRAIVRRLGIG
jgi:chromosomal replication initiation ATPase DnaA